MVLISWVAWSSVGNLTAESSVLDFVCVHPSFSAANLAGVPVNPHYVWTETADLPN